MTTDDHSAGRADLRGNDDRIVGLARLAIGLLQGIALYLLFRTAEGSGETWSYRHPETFAPLVLTALFLPPVLLAGVGRLRWNTLIVWGAVAAAMTGFLAWHDIARQAGDMGRQGTPPLFAFSAAALFIAHHLVLPADRERRLIASYPAYFDAAWMAGVQLALSIAFAGAFWLLLFLGAALFNIIGLSFLGDLIQEAWFSFPLTGLAFATAVHLTDVRDGLIRGVRTIALMLLSWLLLVLTVLVGGFLAALPFTGLQGLWETGSATALILGAAGALTILINAAYQDGRPDNLPPAVLRVAVRVAAVLLTPLIVLAFWGLSLRIGQHGLTPDRIIATACALVGAAYAIGYGLGALVPFVRKDSPWMKALETTNIVTGVLVVAVVLALFSPLADPARLSVADQIDRLEKGKVAADQFDYAFLQFESGKAGRAALTRLVASDDPEIAGRAAEASSAESAYDLRKTEEVTTPIMIAMWPSGAPVPEGLIGEVSRDDPRYDCRDEHACLATVVDLNNDGEDEILLATRGDLELMSPGSDGQWRHIGSYRLHGCTTGSTPPSPLALMRRGTIQAPATPEWPALRIGEEAVSLTPSRSCHPVAVGEAVSGRATR
ncbi:DUF4153 domain-containing protein [Brevundimonas sp.]